ncbi:MAG: hypothetical protein JWO06_2169, partial [Bacteroidota bacterium]|nr:hypothetical protein [Bacteroidota bacterium]
MKFADNFNEVLLAFAAAQVEFLVVGGYAVNFYGYDRTTSDLDIWINPVDSNKPKISNALIHLNYISEGDQHVSSLDFSQPCCFRLGDDTHTVDIFTHVVGVNFMEAWAEKVLFQTEGKMNIYFISVHHLIINKMLAGRDKDKI